MLIRINYSKSAINKDLDALFIKKVNIHKFISQKTEQYDSLELQEEDPKGVVVFIEDNEAQSLIDELEYANMSFDEESTAKENPFKINLLKKKEKKIPKKTNWKVPRIKSIKGI